MPGMADTGLVRKLRSWKRRQKLDVSACWNVLHCNSLEQFIKTGAACQLSVAV